MDQYVKVNIKESVRTKLKEQAAAKGMTLADYIESLAAESTPDEGERLLEELDNKNEHPEDYMSDDDKAILENLAPGELPACCQEIFDDPEHPVPTCKHWRKAYENYYGQRMWGYVNDLVSGGYRTWFDKYVK
jgi:hypothetical protein